MMQSPPLVLSLFPGADLLGRAFESYGCSVVRGPELLLGQQIDEWVKPPPGRFDGIIAGPPCQPFSRAKGSSAARHKDYLPYCFDLVKELGVKFASIENVLQALSSHGVPDQWGALELSDWECGGITQRKRLFYIYPRDAIADIPSPHQRNGRGAYSVLASSNKPKSMRAAHGSLTPSQAGRLQGYPEIADCLLAEADVGKKGHRLIGARLIVHLLGNGVPKAMGEYLARYLLASVYPGYFCCPDVGGRSLEYVI